jgi:hypothetical protein
MRRLRYLVLALAFAGTAEARADTCTLTSRDGEQCLNVTNSTTSPSGRTEYHWTMHNRCEVPIEVSYFQYGSTLGMQQRVPARGEANANGGGFVVLDPAKEGYHDFHVSSCSPSGKQAADQKGLAGENRAQPQPQGDQACSAYKQTCLSGCGDRYNVTDPKFPACTDFCKSPCSNGQLREANPYLAPSPTPSAQQAAPSSCSDNACRSGCANLNQVLGSSAARVCQQSCAEQVSQCNSTGRQPTYQIAQANVARRNAAVPPPAAKVETPQAEQRPAQQREQERQYASENHGRMVECVNGSVYRHRDILCLGTTWFNGGLCDQDIVNGHEAYVCPGNDQMHVDMYRTLKKNFTSGNSW